MIMKHLRLILVLAFALVTVSCGKFNTNKKLHAVDLGLSVKWANMNVGALKPEASGIYFAWGEVEPKKHTLKIITSGARTAIRLSLNTIFIPLVQ